MQRSQSESTSATEVSQKKKKFKKPTKGQVLASVGGAFALGVAGIFGARTPKFGVNSPTLGTPVSPAEQQGVSDVIHTRDEFAKRIAESYLTATPTPFKAELQEPIEKIKQASVRIIFSVVFPNTSADRRRTGEGTVIYNSDGTLEVLTAGHVVDLRSSDYGPEAKINKVTLFQPQFSQTKRWEFPVTEDTLVSGLDDGVDLGLIVLHGNKAEFDNLPFAVANIDDTWKVSPFGGQELVSYQLPDVLVGLGQEFGEEVALNTQSSVLSKINAGQFIVGGNLLASGASGAVVADLTGDEVGVMSSSALTNGKAISSFTPLSDSKARNFLARASNVR